MSDLLERGEVWGADLGGGVVNLVLVFAAEPGHIPMVDGAPWKAVAIDEMESESDARVVQSYRAWNPRAAVAGLAGDLNWPLVTVLEPGESPHAARAAVPEPTKELPPPERKRTCAEYVAAFTTWATVARLSDEERLLLASALGTLSAVFRSDEQRLIETYCAAFEAYLAGRAEEHDSGRVVATFQTRIRKSCLLDRLLYVGEPLRTVPCPLHKGRWSGCFMPPCPHGCDRGCGCTSGWVSELPAATPTLNHTLSLGTTGPKESSE